MTAVNPPGFDMRNALHADDVVWPIGFNKPELDTWGRMLVADREASLTMARYGLERAQVYDTTASYVRSQINAAIAWKTSQEPWSIY